MAPKPPTPIPSYTIYDEKGRWAQENWAKSDAAKNIHKFLEMAAKKNKEDYGKWVNDNKKNAQECLTVLMNFFETQKKSKQLSPQMLSLFPAELKANRKVVGDTLKAAEKNKEAVNKCYIDNTLSWDSMIDDFDDKGKGKANAKKHEADQKKFKHQTAAAKLLKSKRPGAYMFFTQKMDKHLAMFRKIDAQASLLMKQITVRQTKYNQDASKIEKKAKRLYTKAKALLPRFKVELTGMSDGDEKTAQKAEAAALATVNFLGSAAQLYDKLLNAYPATGQEAADLKKQQAQLKKLSAEFSRKLDSSRKSVDFMKKRAAQQKAMSKLDKGKGKAKKSKGRGSDDEYGSSPSQSIPPGFRRKDDSSSSPSPSRELPDEGKPHIPKGRKR